MVMDNVHNNNIEVIIGSPNDILELKSDILKQCKVLGIERKDFPGGIKLRIGEIDVPDWVYFTITNLTLDKDTIEQLGNKSRLILKNCTLEDYETLKEVCTKSYYSLFG